MSEQASHQPSGSQPSPPGKDSESQRDWARISSLGVEFAVTVGLIGGLGFLLDSRLGLLHVFPVFLLLGVFLGMGLGIYRLDYQLKAWLQRTASDPADKDKPLDKQSDQQ